jgi:hypothetical protein
VMGRSRVPFEGSLKFDLHQDGALMTSVEEKTPILLAGDDETVEISWNGTLDPGIYRLTIQLLGNDGDLLDVEEAIIEAKIPPRPPVAKTEAEDEGSGTTTVVVIAAVILISAAAVVVMRRRRKS